MMAYRVGYVYAMWPPSALIKHSRQGRNLAHAGVSQFTPTTNLVSVLYGRMCNDKIVSHFYFCESKLKAFHLRVLAQDIALLVLVDKETPPLFRSFSDLNHITVIPYHGCDHALLTLSKEKNAQNRWKSVKQLIWILDLNRKFHTL